MVVNRVQPRRAFVFLLGVAALGVVAAGMLAAEPASAQLPAICDQYPQNPNCDGDIGPTGGSDVSTPPGSIGPTGTLGATAGVGEGAGAELPFTGYPLSALILLLLLLLLIGLAIRAYLAIRDRIQARSESGPVI